ncbi:hypothetical protein EDB47_1732, partial [Vibrio crassostreae]
MLSRAKYLYRTEYFEAQKNTNNGTILIQSSLNQNIYLSFSILVLIAIIAFVIFAEYTRRETLVGVVSPIGGMVKVKSNDSGYIDNLFVKEGDKVNRLTPLYEIKTERFDGFGVGVKKRILASIEKQHQLLIERKLQESNKAAFENDALTRDLNRLETEVGILNNVLKLSHQELKLAKNLINQQKTLLDKNFVSELDYQKQQLDFLSKQSNAENQNL